MSKELIYWKCLKCGRHLAVINKMDGSFSQDIKCSSCKSLNKITVEGDRINCDCERANNS